MTTIAPPLLVFIGPSGTGKSSVVRRLVDRGVVTVHPTWTTRPRRSDEITGSVDHHFVSEAEFMRRRADGFFLHTVSLFGLPHWYGLPTIEWSEGDSSGAKTVDAVMLRAPLVPFLRSVYSDLVIYQIEAPHALVVARLAQRDCTSTEIDARLIDNAAELAAGRRVADRRFRNNRPLDAVVDEIERAVRDDFARVTLEAR